MYNNSDKIKVRIARIKTGCLCYFCPTNNNKNIKSIELHLYYEYPNKTTRTFWQFNVCQGHKVLFMKKLRLNGNVVSFYSVAPFLNCFFCGKNKITYQVYNPDSGENKLSCDKCVEFGELSLV